MMENLLQITIGIAILLISLFIVLFVLKTAFNWLAGEGITKFFPRLLTIIGAGTIVYYFFVR